MSSTPYASSTSIGRVTDNTTGTASSTVAAGVGVYNIQLPIACASITAADIVTAYLPGHKFKILAVDWYTTVVVTTAAKAATLTTKIGTSAVTGGVLSLTSAALTPVGVKLAGSAVTAANTGTSTDTIEILGSAVTSFVEGSGFVNIRIQNMDVADSVATILAMENKTATF